MRRYGLTTLVVIVLMTPASMASASVPAKSFKNCTALREKYPNGVAKTRSAAQRTGAAFNPKVYNANKKMDRDKDSAACESKG